MTFYYKTKEGYTLELNFRDYNDRIDIEQLHMFFADQTHRCHYLKNTYIHDEDGFSVSICTVPLIDESGRKYVTLEAMRNDEELISSGFGTNGEGFDFDQRIYLDEYEVFTIADILKTIESGERIDTDTFILAAIHDGVHNIRFEMNVRKLDTIAALFGIGITSDEDTVRYTCRIVTDTSSSRSYRIHERYKIGTSPVSNVHDGSLLATRSFYLSDFLAMISSGSIKLLPPIGDQSWDHTKEYFRDYNINWLESF